MVVIAVEHILIALKYFITQLYGNLGDKYFTIKTINHEILRKYEIKKHNKLEKIALEKAERDKQI